MKDDILVDFWREYKKNNPDDIFTQDTLVPISSILGNAGKSTCLGQTIEVFYPKENINERN